MIKIPRYFTKTYCLQRTGEEGNYSDLFTENTMLRAENDKLRLRIKSMAETQDSKDEAIAELRAKALCADFAGKCSM